MKIKDNFYSNLDSEPVYTLPSVKNDWYQKGTDEINVNVYIRNINQNALNIEFKEKEIHIKFKTDDEKFHVQYETSMDTVFYWCVKLSNAIQPELCTYKVSSTKMEIALKKRKIGKWNSMVIPMLPGGARIATKEVHKSWNPALGQMRPAEQQAENLQNPSSVAPSSTTNHSSNELPDICHVSSRMYDIGYTGLDNLGNTCFMNSVLQALANTRELRDYFLSQKYKAEINHENPFGAGGRLAHAFYYLLKNLWSGELTTYNPAKLKNIVSSRAPQFNGFMQHDAQEFMAFLLDGLHEEVNRIKVKPNFKQEDTPGRPDHQVAQEAWDLHKSHNDSFMVDKFHGQYKSKLVCPNCGKESITFDPFLFLPVPLPKPTKMISVVFIPRSTSELPVQMRVHVPKDGGFGSDVINLVAKSMSMRPENLRMFESYKSRIHKTFSPNSALHSVTDGDLIILCEVLSERNSCETLYEFTVTQQLEIPLVVERCSKCYRSTDIESGIKIKRCTKCYRAGYCDHECQKADWPEHRKECKKVPQLIGLPFILSVERSKATYQHICHLISGLAKFSVNVSSTGLPDVLDTQQQDGGGDRADQDIKMDENGNPVTIETDTAEPDVFVPFTLRVKDNMNSDSCMVIEDKGNKLLCLENIKNVALEWKNNIKRSQHVTVSGKPIRFKEIYVNDGTSISGATQLQNCIQHFTEPEVLAAQEAWYCPQCKDHCQATKQLSLWQLPDILIIQLKRFSFKNMMWRDKIDRLVEFPVSGLDMQPFCMSAESPNGPPIYDLFSVINHHGGIFGGHYTSYVRLPEKIDSSKSTLGWRLCDDNRVSRVHSEDQVITKSAYVMFYHKRKFSPSPKCDVFSSTIYNDDEDLDLDAESVDNEEKDSDSDTQFEECSLKHPSLSHIGAAGGVNPSDLNYFPTASVFDNALFTECEIANPSTHLQSNGLKLNEDIDQPSTSFDTKHDFNEKLIEDKLVEEKSPNSPNEDERIVIGPGDKSDVTVAESHDIDAHDNTATFTKIDSYTDMDAMD